MSIAQEYSIVWIILSWILFCFLGFCLGWTVAWFKGYSAGVKSEQDWHKRRIEEIITHQLEVSIRQMERSKKEEK